MARTNIYPGLALAWHLQPPMLNMPALQCYSIQNQQLVAAVYVINAQSINQYKQASHVYLHALHVYTISLSRAACERANMKGRNWTHTL